MSVITITKLNKLTIIKLELMKKKEEQQNKLNNTENKMNNNNLKTN